MPGLSICIRAPAGARRQPSSTPEAATVAPVGGAERHTTAWAKQTKAKSTISGGRYGENLYCRPLDLPASAWPPLGKPPAQPQQPLAFTGSGMRAVFLHIAGVRKESVGTGVFLPRTAGNKFEPKKKSGCSTVLVPDRVVQALNLNLDEFAAQPRFPDGFVLSHGDSSVAFLLSIRSVFLVFLVTGEKR
ncbi:uncharacterized protein LOC121978129 [Zingiber officinale]|uniref:uncharacterized protein LOC121978129 n=1 Tax=Zingiber officinale TaxID=94328 RepID=UPI001C4B1487|nr:uncharacterized protein LOC121978129 [Zingiber officinale]